MNDVSAAGSAPQPPPVALPCGTVGQRGGPARWSAPTLTRLGVSRTAAGDAMAFDGSGWANSV